MTTSCIEYEDAHHINKSKVKYFKGFTSVEHLVNYLSDPDTQFWSESRASIETYDPAWRGSASIEESFKLAKYGWPEGLEKLHEINVTDSHQFVGLENTRGLSVAGCRPNVPVMLSGSPVHMVNNGMDNKPVKLYEISVLGSYQSGTKASEVFNFGTAILKLVDYLENKGNRVRLVSSKHNKAYDCGKSLIEVVLKDYEDPVDLNQLAFALCNLSFLRRLLFGVMETFTDPEYVSNYSGGYGQSIPVVPEMYVDNVSRICFKGLYAKRNGLKYNTMEDALASIDKELRSTGNEDLVFEYAG